MADFIHDMSSEIDEMAANDPDIAAELRDKRTNWDLRERIEKIDQSRLLLMKLWAFRDVEQKSVKAECKFCARSVAVAEKASELELVPMCLLCWFRAGRPGEQDVILMPKTDAS